MTDKKSFVWFALALLQTACIETPVQPTAVENTPTAPQQVGNPKAAHIEAAILNDEPVTVEEVPIVKPVVPVIEPAKPEPKPKPVAASADAVQTLLADAQKKTLAKDFDSASATLERALRISPRNAELTYQLATLRLKQSQPRLAEDLAKKAALLAANNPSLKKRSWLLVAEARQRQNNTQGAKEARLKAESFK